MGPPTTPPNWLRSSGGFSPDAGLKKPVALRLVSRDELPRRPAEAVGAAGGRDVDGRAGRPSVLRAHVVGDDFELGHRVGRGLHHLVAEALVARAVGVVVDAVDEEVVERAAQAVDVEAPLARRETARVERRQPHAGREQRQARVITAVERKGPHLLAGDHLAALAALGFEAALPRGHLDFLGELAHLQHEVHAHARAHRHLDVVGEGHGKAFLLGRDQVRADAGRRKLELAQGVGAPGGVDAGGGVGEGD